MSEEADKNRPSDVAPEIDWLMKMDEYLRWKVIGPDLNNPYATPISHSAMAAMAYNRDLLKKSFCVRCLCEGYEVLQLKNLSAPMILTDHPCLSTITRSQISDYFDERGISEMIENEVTHVQEQLREALAKREKAAAVANRGKPVEKKKPAATPAPASASGFRVIRG